MITPLDEAREIAAQALSPDAPAYEVLAVRYGTRETTRAACYLDFEQQDVPDGPLQMDYFFWLLRRDGGKETILVDIGFDPDVGARRGRTCLCDPLAALERLGVRHDSVEHVVVTHLHYDHIGQLGAFADAELIVQQRELDFWADPGPSEDHAVHVEASEVAGVVAAVEAGKAHVLDGADVILPGVGAILVGGHSPGQQSLVVKGEIGPVLLASDAVHYYEELEGRHPFAILVDVDDMVRGYDTLDSLATNLGASLVPGHDPAVSDRFPSAGDILPGAVLRLG